MGAVRAANDYWNVEYSRRLIRHSTWRMKSMQGRKTSRIGQSQKPSRSMLRPKRLLRR
jgi:hypothetical protein